MKKVTVKNLNLMKNKCINYILLNKLIIFFIFISLLGFGLARFLTVGNFFTLRSFVVDLSLLLFISAITYFFKNKNKFKYFMIWIIIFTTMEMVNVIYYKFYTSYASFAELATLGQVETVGDSLFAKLNVTDFTFLLIPLSFYYFNKHLNKTTYYYILEKVGFKKKVVGITSLTALVFMVFVIGTSTGTDLSRLTNQWNRQSTVQRFSLFFYQLNDLYLTVTPRLFSFIGYDEAAELFNEYFAEYEEPEENEYTGILEGKNIIFVHMESVQTFLMELSYNGEEVLPNTNQLAEEGMFFSNFYPQISTGTSSDSEFTLLSSLMPSSSGTVFVSYYNRYYNTIPTILKEYDYYTFSMHGNNFSMWNRLNAHPSLGYDNYYFEDSYEYTDEDVLGLGINDLLFFEQSFDYLVEIEENNTNYMGTILTLSNHSPFEGVEEFLYYDLTFTNEDGEITDYLGETDIGEYITSAHYADYALGEFMDMVRDSDYFDDTLFVFYGDHDAKFSITEMKEFLSYNDETGLFDLEVEYDTFDHELNKSTPLIFWTKNEELKEYFTGEYDYPMGMIDVAPTILNMFGLTNEYALGNDIFTVKYDNVVVFPSSNFLTNDIYYNYSTEEYKILNSNVILEEGYIEKYLEIAETKLEVSNAIIVYDLILKEGTNEEDEEE